MITVKEIYKVCDDWMALIRTIVSSFLILLAAASRQGVKTGASFCFITQSPSLGPRLCSLSLKE